MAAGESGDPAVYFLSDYGTSDEFVGVVHAVLHRFAPRVPVIDLSHRIPPFDIAAGSAMLERCAPHLGPGVVLAVVDPGVGTARRAVALSLGSTSRPGPRWLVGPDNGLLTTAADALGGVERALQLRAPEGPAGDPVAGASTFDGRDVFAPAAAHLVAGGDPDRLGVSVDPASLERPAIGASTTAPTVVEGPDGVVLTAAVRWVDGFGNVQLDLAPDALDRFGVSVGDRAEVSLSTVSDPPAAARRVVAFGHLDRGELGLLTDANGAIALVVDRASAAAVLAIPDSGSGAGRARGLLVQIRPARRV